MMRLLTAHRILIVTAIIFFVFFALWEFRGFSRTQDGWAVFRAILYFFVALGFGIYLQRLKRWYK